MTSSRPFYDVIYDIFLKPTTKSTSAQTLIDSWLIVFFKILLWPLKMCAQISTTF